MPNEIKNPLTASTSLNASAAKSSSAPNLTNDMTNKRSSRAGQGGAGQGLTVTIWTMAGVVLAACTGGNTRYLTVEGDGLGGGGSENPGGGLGGGLAENADGDADGVDIDIDGDGTNDDKGILIGTLAVESSSPTLTLAAASQDNDNDQFVLVGGQLYYIGTGSGDFEQPTPLNAHNIPLRSMMGRATPTPTPSI